MAVRFGQTKALSSGEMRGAGFGLTVSVPVDVTQAAARGSSLAYPMCHRPVKRRMQETLWVSKNLEKERRFCRRQLGRLAMSSPPKDPHNYCLKRVQADPTVFFTACHPN